MIKNLLYYGNPGLRKKCLPVTEVTEEVRQLIRDLIETVLDQNGAGLAAPQIGVFLRVFVVCYENGMNSEGWPIMCPPKVYINPVLSDPSEELVIQPEGCLSIPGIHEEVSRPRAIKVTYQDENGNEQEELATDWRARAIMHENDHINGVLFVDRIDKKAKKCIEHTLRNIKKKYN